jgi:hypothetical protein
METAAIMAILPTIISMSSKNGSGCDRDGTVGRIASFFCGCSTHSGNDEPEGFCGSVGTAWSSIHDEDVGDRTDDDNEVFSDDTRCTGARAWHAETAAKLTRRRSVMTGSESCGGR